MNKINNLKKATLLVVLSFLGSVGLMAQNVDVDMTFNGGTFDGEIGWEVENTNSGDIEYCVAPGGATPGTTVLSLPGGVTYDVYGYDSFGDGWNGASLNFATSAGGMNLLATNGPGSGGTSNVCNGTVSPGPGDEFLGSFLIIEPDDCAITCPDDITVSNDPGECGAFVNVPAPTTMDCAATMTTVLMDEGFSDGNLPAGWSVEKDGVDASGDIGPCGAIFSFDCTSDQFFTGLDPSFDGNFATIDDDAAGLGEASVKSIITETVDLSGSALSKSLSYSYSFDDLSSEMIVEVWDGTDWVVVQSLTSGQTGVANIDISSYDNSDFQVRFTYDDLGGWDWGLQIDNVEVSMTESASDVIVINDYNGTEDASDFYPVGTTEVTFMPDGRPDVTCTMTITVEDVEDPTMDCPSDQTISLDPGECDFLYTFDIEVDDNCPASTEDAVGPYCDPCQDPSGGAALACAPFAENSIIQFVEVPSDGFIEYFCYNQETFGDAPLATIFFYDEQPGGDVPFNGGGFTPLGSVDYQTDAADDGTCVCVDLPTPIDVSSPGVWVEVYTPGLTLNSRIVQTPENCDGSSASGTNTYQVAPLCGNATPTLFSDFGFPNFDASFKVGFNPGAIEADPTNTPGFNDFASGDVLPIGEHCFEYEVEDNSGNMATCSWCVTVEEFPDPSRSLACNDHVNVSVDENCEAVIGADDILEGGPYGCYEEYIVQIATDMDFNNIVAESQPGDEGAFVSGAQVGDTFFARVIDPETGNSCWGTITIEDKLLPDLNCTSVDVKCGADLTPGNEFLDPEVLVDMTWMSGTFDGEVGWEVVNTSTNEVVFCEEPGTPPAAGTQTLVLEDGVEYEVYGYDSFGDGWNGGSILFEDVATGDVLLESTGPPAGSPNTCGGGPTGGDLLGSFLAEGELITIPFPADGDATLIDENTYVITGFDACGDVTASYTDEINQEFECDNEFVSEMFRFWEVVDESGNTKTCADTFNVIRSSLDDVIFPPNYDGSEEDALACDGGNWDDNENGYPDPEETGAPNQMICDNILTTYTDQVIDVCEGTFKVIRKWTYQDWCTSETVTHNQLIKVQDDEGPELVCPPTATVSTGANDCVATYSVPDISGNITDVCSPNTKSWTVESSAGEVIEFGNNVYQIIDLPVGSHTITYTVDDGCGNETTCEQTLVVNDAIPPVAVCDQNTKVSLGADGTARVYWQTVEDGSYDNCGIASIQVRRMNREFDCEPQSFFFKDYVEFCCADIERSPVQVLFRVTDNSGNQNTCMVNVNVEDKLPPVIVPPQDLTLSCVYPFDLWDLDEFGTVANLNEDEPRLTREIYDRVYEEDCLGNFPYDPNVPTYSFLDGYAQDNCTLEVEDDYNDQRDDCGRGVIVRTFRATDEFGNTNTAFQRLTFQECNTFSENDIRWPRDRELECDASGDYSTDPDATGEPTWSADESCPTIAVRYEDEVFEVVPDACFKILRKWTVLDWCQYEEVPGGQDIGSWSSTQVIKVNDSQAPELQVCDDVTFCDTAAVGCTGYAELIQEVEDCTPEDYLDITWRVKPFNQGNNPNDDIVGSGLDASGYYPFGTHKITWLVEDMCGNVGTCQYLFTVEDCKKPTPTVLNGLATVVMPSSGCIDVNIDLFEAGSYDNCGGVVLSYSSDTTDTVRTFCCDDGIGSKEVEFWVTDEAGNQEFVRTYVRIQDPNEACGNQSLPPMTGSLVSNAHNGDGLEGATVRLEDMSSPTPAFTQSDANGAYQFLGDEGSDYEITAEKNDDHLNGVSTFDILLIQQHILGINTFEDPYTMIAANVNDDDKISGFDLIELRKVILGLETEFPNNHSWRFVNAEENLENGQLPRGYNEKRSVQDLQSAVHNLDFVAVKIGDVNGSAQINGLTSTQTESRTSALVLQAKDEILEAGEVAEIAVSSEMFTDVLGYQMTLNYGSSVEIVGVESGAIDVENNYGLLDDRGVLTMSWNDVAEQTVEAEETLFTIKVKANDAVRLSNILNVTSDVTRAEAYVAGGERDIDLRFTSETAKEFALYQNVPNPFENKTVISFDLPEAGTATLTVFDLTGKVVYEQTGEYGAGNNRVEVSRTEMNGNGVMYYQLESGDYSATKKMIVIE